MVIVIGMPTVMIIALALVIVHGLGGGDGDGPALRKWPLALGLSTN